MLILAFILGIVLVAASGRLVARAVVVPRMHLKIHLREISDYGFETHFEDNDVALVVRLRRTFVSSARRTGRLLIARVPSLTPLSTSELNAADFFRAHKLKYKILVYQKESEYIAAYDAGRCDGRPGGHS